MAKLYEACGNYNKRHKKGLNSTFRRLLASKLIIAARAYKLTPGIKPGGNCTNLAPRLLAPKLVRLVKTPNIMVSWLKERREARHVQGLSGQ